MPARSTVPPQRDLPVEEEEMELGCAILVVEEEDLRLLRRANLVNFIFVVVVVVVVVGR